SRHVGRLPVVPLLFPGFDCATAGAATADTASPPLAALRNSRRFMASPLWLACRRKAAGGCDNTPRSDQKPCVRYPKSTARKWRMGRPGAIGWGAARVEVGKGRMGGPGAMDWAGATMAFESMP